MDYIDEDALRKMTKEAKLISNPPRKASSRPFNNEINWRRIERMEAQEGRTEQVYDDNEYLNPQEEDSG